MLKLTVRERKAIALSLKRLRRQKAFNDGLQNQLRRESSRRRKIAMRFREQLSKRLFKAAGIDVGQILERQKSEDQAQYKRIAELRPRVDANSKQIAMRQANEIKLIKTKTERWKRIPPPDPPLVPERVLLDRAAAISLSSYTKTEGTATNETPWYNTVQAKIKGSGSYAGDFSPDLQADVTFVYTPDRAGSVHAWAWVITNGSLSWTTDSSCLSTPTISAYMVATTTLQQINADGTPNDAVILPSQSVSFIDKTIGIDHHCLGDSGYSIIDNFMQFETTAFDLNVVAGLPIVINVSIDLQVDVVLGTIDLDLATNSQEINVPAVILYFS